MHPERIIIYLEIIFFGDVVGVVGFFPTDFAQPVTCGKVKLRHINAVPTSSSEEECLHLQDLAAEGREGSDSTMMIPSAPNYPAPSLPHIL